MEKPISELIAKLMDTYHLSDRNAEVNVINSWQDIVGDMIAKHTSGISIKKTTLFLSVTSAPLRSELSYHKSVLIAKVNEFAGKELIKEIVIK